MLGESPHSPINAAEDWNASDRIVSVTPTFAAKIDPIAIYAAILSTIVFIWNVFVWWRTGPRLRVSAASN